MSIFVIDEHPLMREAIVALLARMGYPAVELGDIAAVAEAADAHGLPGMICMESSAGDLDGTRAIRQLHSQFPSAAIVVFTASTAPDAESRALEAGASAFLHKSAKSDAIARTLQGFLPADATADNASAATPEKLSKRQKQLLNLLDKGMSNRDIAESLQISEHTVKVHLWRLFRRLNVKSRSQASHLARTQGLL
ncbi:MAG: response regulator transcription factor [Pseudomonadota bacterium]